MPKEVIRQHIARLTLDQLKLGTGSRNDIISEHGKDSLYTEDVNGTVSHVSPIPDVRKAVKAGFVARVEQVRDEGRHDVLAVDGRNLAQVIEQIPGTRLLMSTFVSCSAFEAAWRECERQGIDLSSPEGDAILARIKRRNADDATREQDPVKPAPDAIDYWTDTIEATQRFADALYEGDFDRALEDLFVGQQGTFTHTVRLGAGALAASSGRQILFDTGRFREISDDPKKAMLRAADTMFDEALDGLTVRTAK